MYNFFAFCLYPFIFQLSNWLWINWCFSNEGAYIDKTGGFVKFLQGMLVSDVCSLYSNKYTAFSYFLIAALFAY